MFRRHLALTLCLLAFFIFLGFEGAVLVLQFENHRWPSGSPVFLARLIDQIPGDAVQATRVIEEANHKTYSRRLWLLDADGRVLFPAGRGLPMPWRDLPHPRAAYQRESFQSTTFPPTLTTVVRLAGNPARYLLVQADEKRSRAWQALGVSVFFQAIAVTCGMALSMLLLHRAVKKKARLADTVLSELQRGNLKARFPISKMDELGQAMLRFNAMADEIERLVERVQSAEGERMQLIQELAHDLRTPLASLGSLLETLVDHGDSIDTKVREEFLNLAVAEVRYFAKLVDDFLFLARVSEPRYRKTTGAVALADIVRGELEKVSVQYGTDKRAVVTIEPASDEASVSGDPHVLRRALRNVLDNAFSFARGEVAVRLRRSERRLELIVQDDGPGLSEEALKGFGEKRIGRALGHERNGRLSVGLGSVIVKTVAVLHRGEVSIRNRFDPLGNVLGAELRFSLPAGSPTITN